MADAYGNEAHVEAVDGYIHEVVDRWIKRKGLPVFDQVSWGTSFDYQFSFFSKSLWDLCKFFSKLIPENIVLIPLIGWKKMSLFVCKKKCQHSRTKKLSPKVCPLDYGL